MPTTVDDKPFPLPEAEAADPFCLDPGEAARLLARHPWRRFAAVGDSVIQGIGDLTPGYTPLPWCHRIAAELTAAAPELEYLNLGKRDLTAAEVRESQLDRALAFEPDLVLVVCGGNDALRSSYDADAVDRELAAIITPLQAQGADVITVGIFDISYAPSFPDKVRRVVSTRMQAFSRHTAALAQRLNTIHVNCTNHPAQSDPDGYSEDGLHGNMRSHSICAAITIRRLGAYLADRR